MRKLRLLSVCSKLLVLTLFCLAGQAAAVVNSTQSRLVFNDDSLAESLTLVNSEKSPAVVQLWTDDNDPLATPDKISTPLVVVPPVFKLAPGESRNVRIILLSRSKVPNDRERVWWLNIYQIPPNTQASGGSSQKVVLPLRIRLKVFVRPVGLAPMTEKAGEALTFSLINGENGQQLKVNNPTRYHMTLGNLSVGTRSFVSPMIAPLSSTLISVNDLHTGMSIDWSIIDDFGKKINFQHRL